MSEKTVHICPICETHFMGWARSVCCSNECSIEYGRRKRAAYIPHAPVISVRICPVCGAEFDTVYAKKTYCSPVCRGIAQRDRYRAESAKKRGVSNEQ